MGVSEGLSLESAVFLMKAAQLEGRAALDALAADISHQLSHALAFLRCLTIADSTELTAEDRELATVEVERIQLLMRQLLVLRMPSPLRVPTPALQLLKQASAALSAPKAARNVELVLDVPEHVVLHAEPGLLYILIRDMLASAIARAAPDSIVTACLLPANASAEATLTIKTSSHDAAVSPLEDPFNPWNSNTGAPGPLGLAVAYRIARTFGWTLSASSTSVRPGLLLSIPASAFSREPA